MGIKRSIIRRFWINRGLGMHKNPIDDRDRIYNYKLENVGNSLPEWASLEANSVVVDQSSTSSCVGNAVAGAVRILENRNGKISYGYPSRMFLYWNSRAEHETEPFDDDGTYVRACCKALKKFGVPDESIWPFNKKDINKKPRFGTWMRADPRKNGEYLAIFEVGESRIDAIKTAICEGYPVVFGTDVAKSFMPAIGDEVIHRPKSTDKIVGGHAMVIVGYRTTSTGRTEFRVMNSWGGYWRDNGYCYFDEDYITWNETRDFTIVKGWENVR